MLHVVRNLGYKLSVCKYFCALSVYVPLCYNRKDGARGFRVCLIK